MKLPRLSIQNSLLITLVLICVLVMASSIVAWLAFSRVSDNQQHLLSQTLPAMRFIDRTVNAGADLLDVGFSLNQVLSSKELGAIESKANHLFKGINADIDQFDRHEISYFDIQGLQKNTQDLVSNVVRQLELQKEIVKNRNLIIHQREVLQEEIDKALVEIKLISGDISLMALDKNPGSDTNILNFQMFSLMEIRFEVQGVKLIIDGIRAFKFVEQVRRDQDLYRLKIHKIGNNLLSLDEAYRQRLSKKLGYLNDFLPKENNIFLLSIKQVENFNLLNDIQKNNSVISQSLNKTYKNISALAGDELDVEAQYILGVIKNSKLILFVSISISLMMAFLFWIYFIKPRLIERLLKLTENTQAIANSHYHTDIEIDGHDEISDMAKSLSYFRDQLIEKQNVQERLADRERALSTIISNAVDGLFTVDLQGIIRTFNPACEKFFNAGADAVLGQNVNLLLPYDIDIFSEQTARLEDLNGDSHIICQDKQVIARRYGGENFFGSLSVSLINLSGRYVYSCFLRDITNEHEAKERIELLIEQLTNSNSDLEQFAYSCSHDLQEPVRMILSFSSLLRDSIEKNLDEKSEKYLSYIEQGARNAKQLISDMLAYSRLNQSSFKKTEVSLDDLCHKVKSMMFAHRVEGVGGFDWTNGEIKLCVVEPQILQLLTNLISNGLKYNQSKQPLVKISATENDEEWLLCVSDNGIGIKKRYQKKIFDMFSRLVNRHEYEGSGIGLAICHKVVERHGGKIWVESVEGQGSQFYVRLPKA